MASATKKDSVQVKEVVKFWEGNFINFDAKNPLINAIKFVEQKSSYKCYWPNKFFRRYICE